MADNKVIDNGTLTDVTWATDEIGGVDYQRVKISVGADGAAVDMRPPADSQPASTMLPAQQMLWDDGLAAGRYARTARTDGETGQSIAASGGMVYNGSTWDRARVVADALPVTGVPATAPMLWDQGTSQMVRQRNAAQDAQTAGYGAAVTPMLWNGATTDRQRGNLEGTLLASAARTATTASATQTNYNHRGVLLQLVVTSAGTGNVYISINAGIPGGGAEYQLCQGTALTTTGTIALLAYPGVLDADTAVTNMDGRAIALPRTWLGYVNKSDGSSWTYALGYSLIL